MKRKLLFIIVGAVVLLLLAGGIVALTLLNNADDETEAEETTVSEEEEESRLLYDKDPDSIVKIHVENSTGEYDIERYPDGESWGIMEFDGHQLYDSGITGALNVVSSLTAQRVVTEDCDDLSIYGLDEPSLKFTVEFDSGEYTVLIGNEVPTESNSYMRFEGENTVYTVKTSTFSTLQQSKYYFVEKTVYTAKEAESEDDDTDYTRVDKISISRQDIDYDIVIEYDIRQDDEDAVTGNSSSHVLTEPVELDLNPDTSDAVVNGVFGLTASGIAAMSPTDAELEAYGLADPFAVVDFDIVGGDFSLTIGSETNGYYYAMAEGFDIVFIFAADDLPWATVMPMDITMTLITSTYIYNVEELTIATADSENVFKLSGGADDFAVKCNGETISAELFKSFYQFLLRAPAEEIYLTDTDEEVTLTVTIDSTDGTDVLEFIPSSDRMTIIKLNGRTSFKCRTAYVDRLAENLEHLLAGEDMVTVW